MNKREYRWNQKRKFIKSLKRRMNHFETNLETYDLCSLYPPFM